MADDQRDLPPIDWFRDPGLTEPTPITITSDGRLFGHIAEWDCSHIGLPNHVKPPRSGSDYYWFHRGTAEVVGDDGQRTIISAGNLTANAGHAPMTATASETDRHYDDSASIVAKVNAGEDRFGIWCSGQLAPGIDEMTRWRITACGLSGDWRAAEQGEYRGLELRAALFVPVTGFPIGRARVASAAKPATPPMAMVAAGMLPPSHTESPDAPSAEPRSVEDGRYYARAEVDSMVDHLMADAVPAVPPASNPKSPDLSQARTPEEIVRMSTDQHTPEPDEQDDDTVTAAGGGNPFAKGGDDTPDAGGDYEAGDTVLLNDSDFVGQVIGSNDDGGVVVELTLTADQLSKADEAMAAAAYARFDERQQDRVRDAERKRQAEQLSSVTASLEMVTAELRDLREARRKDEIGGLESMLASALEPTQ